MQVKGKFNYKILAVFAAVLVAVCSLFAFLPFGKKVNSASAAVYPRNTISSANKDDLGFSTYTSQMGALALQVNPTFNIEDVDSSGTSIFRGTAGYDAPIWVAHGIDFSYLLYQYSTALDDYLDSDPLSWVYVSMNFKQPWNYNFATSDLYITDPNLFTQITFYDYNNLASDAYFEEVIIPMSLVRYYRLVVGGNTYYPADSQKIRSIVFKMNGTVAARYTDFYVNGGSNVPIFTLPKGYFSDSTSAYNQGYEVGYEVGVQHGDERSYQVGYGAGYNVGYANGSAASSSLFSNLISSAIDVPIKSFLGLLDFEVFGVDMSTFILSLFSIALVLSIVRRFI